MNKLKILGLVELRRDDENLDHSFVAGPKRLALLAYLILNRPRGMQRRDRVLPLLWPEKGQDSARNSLSNILYHIRKSLGEDILITRGSEELGVDTTKLQCDALEFEILIEKGAMAEAVKMYRGDLLDGLYVPDASSDLEQWIELERERFRNSFGNALETLAEENEQRGNYTEAAEWWIMKSRKFPYDTGVVRRILELLTATGNRGEALRRADQHAKFLQQELDIDHRETLEELTADLDKTPKLLTHSQTLNNRKSDQLVSRTVAILPFETFGEHKEKSNFSGGLHNDLLTRLSGISSIDVISRTSVLQYHATNKAIPQIAAELGAGTVIEGSVQFSKNRLRLNIQLIDVKNDNHIWAEIFDRELTAEHFFDIQSELSLKITDSLKARLSPSERKRVMDWTPTDDLEAHRLYIYGRRVLDQRTEIGMKKAVEYFQRAVNHDPEHALAWVGLADAYSLQFDYGYKDKESTLPLAEEAVHRAIELDSNLAEAHTSLGLLYSNKHLGSAAIRKLQHAVELQPGYAEAHNWLSWNYQLLGDAAKALESAKKSVNLNPLSPEAVSNLSISYLYNGYYTKALAESLQDADLQPDWSTTAFYQALALFELKRYSEAKTVLKDLSVPWAGNGPLATLALCHILDNEMDKAEKIMTTLYEKDDLFSTGLIHAAYGNKENALELFEQVAYWDDWETLSIHHLYKEILGPLKNDSRFKKIHDKVYQSRGLET